MTPLQGRNAHFEKNLQGRNAHFKKSLANWAELVALIPASILMGSGGGLRCWFVVGWRLGICSSIKT